MSAWTRKLTIGAGAGLLAAAAVFSEPFARPQQHATADSWQLYYGSEYNFCEGCCQLSFCCAVNHRCQIIVH